MYFIKRRVHVCVFTYGADNGTNEKYGKTSTKDLNDDFLRSFIDLTLDSTNKIEQQRVNKQSKRKYTWCTILTTKQSKKNIYLRHTDLSEKLLFLEEHQRPHSGRINNTPASCSDAFNMLTLRAGAHTKCRAPKLFDSSRSPCS